ncbi:MAG: hypothetical protein GY950_10500, partial [bacterium]|nr:hypothetical protein [bacterium]
TNFSTNALKQFDDLINAGATEKEALRLLGPQLENLIKYGKTYDLTIDSQTNSLINRARQEGVLAKESKTEGEQQINLQERMVSILEGIGEHFGVKIPKAMDEMASSGESASGKLEAHWESLGLDVEMVRDKLLHGIPFSYRAMMEAAQAAKGAADATSTIESIDDWNFSLGEVEETIKTNLLEANQELDAASQTTIGNIINYLKNTSEEGANTTMTFSEIKEKIEELGGSYETLLGETPEAFLEVSGKMKDKIDELTLTMGDSHAATSTLMSQIIAQADIDVTNFDLYAARTGEIIEDYKNGALDLEQTTEAMGAAFNNILGEAQRLGTEGTEQMVGMLQAAREAGVEVAEMHEYVNEKLQDGVTSLATYIKSFEGSEEKGSKMKEEIAANWEFMQSMALASFKALEEQGYSFVETLGMMQQPLADLGTMAKENGLEVSEGLQRMTNIAVFNEQNQALMSRIEATRGMMEALGDSAFLTANDFTMFSQQTMAQFDDVLAKSGDQETAMRLVAPALQDLIKYADSYGFAIDDNTQALIDQGVQQGLVSEQTKTDSQVTNDLLLLIAQTLGATIPESLANLTGQVSQSMTTIEGQTGAWGNSLDRVKGKLANDLPGAVRNLDKEYTDAMTGHSIVTETGKWQDSLNEVDDILGRELLETADSLDDKYKHVTGNIYDYLENTSKGGYLARLSFDEMVDELEKLKDTYNTMAQKKMLSEDEKNLMADYERQIGELSQAIEETAPTAENLGKKFKELQEMGTEGFTEMLNMINQVRASGMEVAEIQGYINDKLNSGVEALDKYISSYKSTTTLNEEWDTLNDSLGDNQKALEKIQEEMMAGGKSQEEMNTLRKEAKKLEEERTKLLDDTIKKEQELADTEKGLAENWDFMQMSTLATFKALQAEGHSFVEIVGMMDGQLNQLNQIAAENTTLGLSEGLKEMTDMSDFVKQNEGLSTRIDSTKTLMESLGDTAYLSGNDFSMFADQTRSQFDEIIAKGGDSKMALRLMAPALEDLVKYSESYGYTIDENTQGLIDQAREQGLMSKTQKTDAQVTNDILLLMAETLGATIPDSMREMTGAMTESMEGMDEKTARFDESLSGLGQTALEKGVEVKEGLKEMTDMEAAAEQNDEMMLKIEATKEMMATLGESANLTSEDFGVFSEQAKIQFEELVAKTGDNETALKLLGPTLEELTGYSEAYGFAMDENTVSLVKQAEEQDKTAKKNQEEAKKSHDKFLEIAKTLGIEIPDSLKELSDSVEVRMQDIKGETTEWTDSLDTVKDKMVKELPKAIKDLDDKYTDAMTGHSIVTETGKWKTSLEDVNDILGRELLETAESLDGKYKHVTGNIYEYLQKTSKGGYMARMSFDKMVNELERLKNTYDKMALKKKLSDKDKNVMDDLKRQIGELSSAVEESAPTLENFGKKFKEFQDQVSGSVGVNRGMIEMARGLREQGQSLKEIDDIIDKSLSGGSKGLGAWVDALGPAQKEIEELKKLQEDINKLQEKEEKKEEDLAELATLEAELTRRRSKAQQDFIDDQNELLNTQDLVVSYFNSMRAEGKSVAEIMEIMGDSFENLAGKSMKDLTREAGFEMTAAFSDLYEMQQKMADNEGLVKGIDGITEALHGMGDSMLYMSDEEFGRFQQSAGAAFAKLEKSGFSSKQSLQLIAPMLHDLKTYAKEYGFSIDDSTAALMKQAKKEGVLRDKQKSDTEKLVEVNDKLAGVMDRVAGALEKMGKVSPFAQLVDEVQELDKKTASIKGFERKIKGVKGQIALKKGQLQTLMDDLEKAGGASTQTGAGLYASILLKSDEVDALLKKRVGYEKGLERTQLEVQRLREEYNKNMPKEGDYVSAAIGFHGILKRDKWFRVHGGEQVDVWTPEETRKIQGVSINRQGRDEDERNARKRGGDIVFEHITIQSEDGDETVREFMTAIKGNKYGVQNLIRKVAQ